ncbi:adhesion G protein-coupled receptor L3 isoform X2 [Tachysurus ichikawai]
MQGRHFRGHPHVFELEVARMSTDGNLPDLKFPQTGDQSNSIHLSANTLKQHGRNGEIRMAFVLYKHLGTYLSTENASMKFSSEALSTNYTVIVNSPIITAAINKDSNKVYLSDPVVFTVRHIQVRKHLCFIPIHRFISYDCRSIERRARNWSVWPVSLMEGMKYLL